MQCLNNGDEDDPLSSESYIKMEGNETSGKRSNERYSNETTYKMPGEAKTDWKQTPNRKRCHWKPYDRDVNKD